MKTIAEDIRFWAARKAKAETLPPHILERHRETYKAVCARLQTLMDTMLRDAIAVIDTALDARRVNAAAEVMQACINRTAWRLRMRFKNTTLQDIRRWVLWMSAQLSCLQSGALTCETKVYHSRGKARCAQWAVSCLVGCTVPLG